MNKFNVGDTVKLLDGSKDLDFIGSWVPQMKPFVGKTVTITDIPPAYGGKGYKCEGLIWDERYLELVKENKQMTVWVLEKFITNDKACETLISLIEEAEELKQSNPQEYKDIDEAIGQFEQKISENTSGFWSGIEGKTRYKDFCQVAKEAIRRHPKDKYKVVKAEIANGATTWVNYTNAVEHNKVLGYLKATLNIDE